MIFENVKMVEISAVNGKAEIEGWENDHAEVSYTLHGEAEVEVEQRGGEKLIIREEPKKRFFNLLGKSGWAEIAVKVPRKATVKASSVNGEIRARNVSFEKVSTVNGRIELENCEAGGNKQREREGEGTSESCKIPEGEQCQRPDRA